MRPLLLSLLISLFSRGDVRQSKSKKTAKPIPDVLAWGGDDRTVVPAAPAQRCLLRPSCAGLGASTTITTAASLIMTTSWVARRLEWVCRPASGAEMFEVFVVVVVVIDCARVGGIAVRLVRAELRTFSNNQPAAPQCLPSDPRDAPRDFPLWTSSMTTSGYGRRPPKTLPPRTGRTSRYKAKLSASSTPAGRRAPLDLISGLREALLTIV